MSEVADSLIVKGVLMNKYLCFYRNRQVEIMAESSEQARQKALSRFQKKAGGRKVKPSEVFVAVVSLASL
jgi:hypothetical protein